MATCCGDCMHNAVCEIDGYIDKCKHFKNKANFVELIRCKECKHWNNGYCEGIPFCGDDASYIETEETDFCSYGERKDT